MRATRRPATPALALLAIALSLQLLLPPAFAQRIALVIGNAAYADRPLRNPVNDAQLMQATLRDLGFHVQVATNVDRRGLLEALRDFEARARGAEVALFYFAGHGAQVGGANYLIPVNAPIRSETDVPDEALDAASVLRRIEEGRARVGLVILDACRDKPFPGASRSSTRGLARMSVPTGTIVAYATAPGSTANDGGSGPNGLYTGALARYMATPGLDIKEVFDRTAQEVERLSNGKQRPREDVGLRGRFALLDLRGADSNSAVAVVEVAAEVPTAGPDPEVELWELAKRRDRVAAFQAYLRVYPEGRYAAVARAAVASLEGLAAVTPAAPPVTAITVKPETQVALSMPAIPPPAVSAAAASVAEPASLAAPSRLPPEPPRRPVEVFKDCAECPEMVVIPAGRFLMGSPPNEVGRFANEGPQRWVDVPRSAMGKLEVTQGEWLAVMGSNPSRFSSCGLNCPVENVSWDDAQEFVRRLSQRTGQKYRLPSEAEWEYAARAGSTTAYPWGERARRDHANYGADTCCSGLAEGRDRWVETAPVGQFLANAFGLHDMHGNVWEWVQDVWHDNYARAPSDGSAWMNGDDPRRVLRGGSWVITPQDLRSAYRGRGTQGNRIVNTGFRLAKTF